MPQQRRQWLDLMIEHAHVSAQISTGERDCDRWNSDGYPLHRRGDCARVEHILTHVLAVIDAAQYEIRPLGHQSLDRDHYAIRGSAIDLPSSLAELDRTHWMMERQRVARCALLPVRRNNRHLAERLGSCNEASQTVSKNAVIIGAEKSHQFPCIGVIGRGLCLRNAPDRCAHSTPITFIAS